MKKYCQVVRVLAHTQVSEPALSGATYSPTVMRTMDCAPGMASDTHEETIHAAFLLRPPCSECIVGVCPFCV